VLDGSGRVANASSLTVTMAIASGGCDSVTGLSTAIAVRGIAKFTDLEVASVGAGASSNCALSFAVLYPEP